MKNDSGVNGKTETTVPPLLHPQNEKQTFAYISDISRKTLLFLHTTEKRKEKEGFVFFTKRGWYNEVVFPLLSKLPLTK